MFYRSLPKAFSGVMALLALGIAPSIPARADVILSTSEGTGISSDLGVNLLLATVEANVTVAHTDGTAPSVYNNSTGTVNVNGVVEGDLGLLGSLLAIDSATLTSTANSNVDGAPGTRTVIGTSLVEGLDGLGVVSLLSPSLLTLSATTISVSAEISGDGGSLVESGSTLFQDLQISVLGNLIQMSLSGTVAPNTELATGIPGLSIILNEQIVSGDGTSTREITVNGVHVIIDALSVVGLGGAISGDLIIAHGQASLTAVATAVPSASSGVLCGIGLSCLAVWRRRTRKPGSAA